MKFVLKRLLPGIIVLSLLFVPATVLAHNGEDHSTDREATQHEREAAREHAQARLDDAQKKICQQRAATIQAIMGRSVKRAENHGQFFTTATERIKNFAQNQSVSVDQSLIDALDRAKVTFEADLATLKTKATFSCDSDSSKDQIAAFQEAHREVQQDLKQWRTALKNLIQSLRAAT